MFHFISWNLYWICIAVASLAYYMFIYFGYFKGTRNQVFHLGTKQDFPSVNADEVNMVSSSHQANTITNQPEDETQANACLDELIAFFENQNRRKAVKGELTYSIYAILKKYPSLKHSDYRDAITNLIATQCKTICSIHLSADELRGVWFG